MRRVITNTSSKWGVRVLSAVATLGGFWMAAGAPWFAK